MIIKNAVSRYNTIRFGETQTFRMKTWPTIFRLDEQVKQEIRVSRLSAELISPPACARYPEDGGNVPPKGRPFSQLRDAFITSLLRSPAVRLRELYELLRLCNVASCIEG
jgi:hypothetical protein